MSEHEEVTFRTLPEDRVNNQPDQELSKINIKHTKFDRIIKICIGIFLLDIIISISSGLTATIIWMVISKICILIGFYIE